ncbi:apolipoprotein N-acyltransferase [Roseivivax sp. THAF30]|uniref:apolipoprotein N-acyltransferase n=1 Tax=Roseivivax sp. THAF30 TaxID=2587852 RepID=UPI001267FF18|nr:apolipoprotein N-acyltransferase [Roseivivax sp. THAF30]QFT61888.1 Apolipoprotein N-acyltransferase [Roseivivax sp. THAF30]
MRVGSKHIILNAVLSHGVGAFMAGAAAVLTLPPFSILALVPAAYGALFLLVRDRNPLVAGALGWLFGLGYFGFGLSWIAESFQIDAERFGALAIPAVAGLSGLLSLFPALAMTLFVLLRRRWLVGGVTAACLFAACWAGAEWLRGHVLTGFPWNLTAYAMVDFGALRQPAAWLGSYGLSFLVILASVLPAQAVLMRGAPRCLALLFFALFVGGFWVSGQARISRPMPESNGISLRIVQGNVPQRAKWAPGSAPATLSRYLRLSTQGDPADVLLWPETAYPGFLDENEDAKHRIAEALRGRRVLLTGAPDRTAREAVPRYFNTIQAYDGSGTILTGYAKHHLVPFGEYVPFADWLPIDRLTAGLGDFTPGPGPRTLAVSGLPVLAAAICYEIIFPGHVVDDEFRPEWIFNATNDAWFGTSIGPEQHLASARMRAVEEGLPVIRAANTGISAVIDANGTIIRELGLEKTGIIDASLPAALPATLYARAGDWVLPPLGIAVWLLSLGLDRVTSRRNDSRRIFSRRPLIMIADSVDAAGLELPQRTQKLRSLRSVINSRFLSSRPARGVGHLR